MRVSILLRVFTVKESSQASSLSQPDEDSSLSV